MGTNKAVFDVELYIIAEALNIILGEKFGGRKRSSLREASR